jgi:hypothetical protein
MDCYAEYFLLDHFVYFKNRFVPILFINKKFISLEKLKYPHQFLQLQKSLRSIYIHFILQYHIRKTTANREKMSRIFVKTYVLHQEIIQK